MFNDYIIKFNYFIILLTCIFSSYIYSLTSSLLIMNSHQRFMRNSIHIPIGFVGGFIINFRELYGIIFFLLLITYQVLEETENLLVKNKDHSWYDVEG